MSIQTKLPQTKNEILKFLKEKGLVHCSSRDLPLFSGTVVAHAYADQIKKIMGFHYNAVAFLGKENHLDFMFNEPYVAQETEKGIAKVQDLLKNATEVFKVFKKNFEASKDILKYAAEHYVDYFVSIGTYNCFWRYVGNDQTKLPHLIDSISRERQEIAGYYGIVEEKLKKATQAEGVNKDFDGDLLRSLTLREMNLYIKERKLSFTMLLELKKRRENYFYIFAEGQEAVYTQPDILNAVEEEYFTVHKEIKVLKGKTAYPGHATGTVFNLQTDAKMNKGSILVCQTAHPKDNHLIRDSVAIIADEGGLLSHAAIVAREMKKPCIIGTKIATKVFKTGDSIEVDATNGIIRKL